MPIDLHYICIRGKNFKWLGEPGLFETGNWKLSDELAELVVGGRVFLHTSQSERAWHGGTIISHKPAPAPEQDRKVFTYTKGDYLDVLCPGGWGQEKAVAYWDTDRVNLLSKEEYLDSTRIVPVAAGGAPAQRGSVFTNVSSRIAIKN
jgi:hypothetical protein